MTTTHQQTFELRSPLGVTLRHELLCHDPPADCLLVMLPGRGYLNSHPLLHFLRRCAAQHGSDVLSVQYGLHVRGGDLDAPTRAALVDEVRDAVRAAVAGRQYRKALIAGKSLGTLLLDSAAGALAPLDCALLLLTPIPGSLEQLAARRALAIIGTADAAYRSLQPEAQPPLPNLTWKILPDLNHGLEAADDWQRSLAALHNILLTCEQFMLEAFA